MTTYQELQRACHGIATKLRMQSESKKKLNIYVSRYEAYGRTWYSIRVNEMRNRKNQLTRAQMLMVLKELSSSIFSTSSGLLLFGGSSRIFWHEQDGASLRWELNNLIRLSRDSLKNSAPFLEQFCAENS